MVLQDYHTGDEETKGITRILYHTQSFIKQRKESLPQQQKMGFYTKKPQSVLKEEKTQVILQSRG